MQHVFVWTLSDVLALGFVGLCAVIAGGLMLAESIKQGMCKHDGGVSESRACHAICRKCRKDLGFIREWRKSAKGGE